MPRQRGYSPTDLRHLCDQLQAPAGLLPPSARARGRRGLFIEQLDAPLIVDFLAHIEQERGTALHPQPAPGGDPRVHALRRASSALGAGADRADRCDPRQTSRPEAHPSPDDGRGARHPERARPRQRSGMRDRAMLHLASPAACASPNWSASCSRTSRSGDTPSVMVKGKGRESAACRSGRRPRATCGLG